MKCSSTMMRSIHALAHSLTHSLAGFCDLIEKDWLAFGHQFARRFACLNVCIHALRVHVFSVCIYVLLSVCLCVSCPRTLPTSESNLCVSLRFGHGSADYKDDQRCPVFLQFIDCVWQVGSGNQCWEC